MTSNDYSRASKYPDLEFIYAQCSGPGGLQLAEFVADRLELEPGMRVLDIGSNRGYQSCFLAKEYGVEVIAIDPWDDREDGRPMVEHVRENAIALGVENAVLPLKLGVPDTPFVEDSFDAVYCTTALEMIRAIHGEAGYRRCLAEVMRVLRPGRLLGLAEPMHQDTPLPEDLIPYVSQAPFGWKDCFRSLEHTRDTVAAVGFETVEANHAPDARDWWLEFATHDPFCKKSPDEDPKTLEVDAGRWVSFGYVIARKPA